ncbi:MAG: c-type cytochrome [Magnetococcales bacterium]|nr:c-type cytochrome [Magnetococcales bacterium]MBF0151642.1 c-type cytochrome [Magnetococcales bacterium]MBF0174800.1 c-type cytochrome [Magnetococcales bacterium]MBF0632641.1 c-type cytochrome [Magnetococcales bacterium]
MLRFSRFVAVVFFLLALPASATENVSHDLYQKYCASCHGRKGEGSSTMSGGMNPPPRVFTDPAGLVDLTRERMIKSVREGRPGTAMSGWSRVLTDAQIEGVVDYIQDRLMPSVRSEKASPGRRLYAQNCSVCHGDRGDTAVWAQSGLNPAPRDFTSERARRELSLERMLFSVRYGRPETAMPAWSGRLTEEEILAVVNYVRDAIIFKGGGEVAETLEPKGAPVAGTPVTGAVAEAGVVDSLDLAAMREPMPQGLQGDPDWGMRFYLANCSVCHGKAGDGRGPRSEFIDPKPRNFRHPASQHKYNRPRLFDVIAKGVVRSEMPAWDKVLTPQEIANVGEYVFLSFISPGHREELDRLKNDSKP